MDVKKIVSDYLRSSGFDGLFNEEGPCGCGLDNLAPCECICLDCEPAYKQKCLGNECKSRCDGFAESGESECFTTVKPWISDAEPDGQC